ncbi:MAG: hypothetical protein LBF57_03745 [Holosporaceae bacterium]|jgi:hypothetical protein|nr:hypothetical protein [Holosporaceae bacterium]
MAEDFNMFSMTPPHDMLKKSHESVNASVGGAATPQYMIKCKDFFMSEVDGMDGDSAPCLWIELGAARMVTWDSSGEQSGDGKIITKDPVVCMKAGSWNPVIQQFMYEGKTVTSIAILRLISIHGTKVVIQEITYETDLIKTYQQHGDTITFSFCYVVGTDVIITYDSEGNKLGQSAVTFDSNTLKVTAKSS